MRTTVLFLLSVLSTVSCNDSYIAAVVDFSPSISIISNVKNIINFIRDAKKENADIIVFPEYSVIGLGDITNLTVTRVPSPAKHISPCDSPGYSTALKRISCAARKYKIYVAVNLVEIAFCVQKHNCTYNTNVVLDRQGAVIARYRKVHPFNEPVTAPYIPDMVVFETDFGVRFGTFICFDILFQKPAIPLVRDFGVTDVIYTNAWISELPFFTAVQVQAAWSFGEDVNLLSAGLNCPRLGNTGSGIYLGRGGVANATMQETDSSTMLMAKVPIKQRKHILPLSFMQIPENYQNVKVEGEESGEEVLDAEIENGLKILNGSFLSIVESEVLKTRSGKKTTCHKGFCCNFEFSLGDSVVYRTVAFEGVRSFYGFGTGGFQICGLIACVNETLESCSERFPGVSKVHNLTITGTFSSHESVTPSSVTSTLLPVPVNHFIFDKRCTLNKCNVNMALTEPTKEILSFSIIGRLFELDGDEVSEPTQH